MAVMNFLWSRDLSVVSVSKTIELALERENDCFV